MLFRSKSDSKRKDQLNTLLERIWVDDDEDYLVQAGASSLIALQNRKEPRKKVEDMLSGEYGKEDYWCTLRALRALCEFPMPDLAENIIFVMREGNYLEHKYEAIRALGTCTDNLKVVRALGDVVRTETNGYLILAAIESLDELKNGEAR